MKKTKGLVLVFALVFAFFLNACAGGPGKDNPDPPGENDHVVTLQDETKGLLIGDYRLDFYKVQDGYGIRFVSMPKLAGGGDPEQVKTQVADENSIAFLSEAPLKSMVRGVDQGLIGSYKTSTYTSAYSKIVETDNGITASGTIESDSGSELAFVDRYFAINDAVFGISREIEVNAANAADSGFNTTFEVYNAADSTSCGEFEFMLPSILYRDSQNSIGIGSNIDLPKMYVKETRMGVPMVFMRDMFTKESLSLAHYRPEISVGGLVGGGSSGTVNGALQYGSLGICTSPLVGVGFTYPCEEGPTSYDAMAGMAQRFHPVEEGYVQKYQLSASLNSSETYTQAMTVEFKKQFALKNAENYEVSLDQVYDLTIDMFDDLYKDLGSKGAGVPFLLKLPDQTKETGEYSFQMGFVGQQAAMGYHLYRTGNLSGDAALAEKGKSVLDFWTSDTIMSGALPIVWWDSGPAQSRGYPAFLRCFVDGMEGVLDGYREAVRVQAPEATQRQYLAAITKVADFLVNKQNADGSYYRAYDSSSGNVASAWDNNTQADSKLNTPIAIRFLIKMYELYSELGDEQKAGSYRNAALKAGEYTYSEIYTKLGKYVGGTPDNSNVLDKEAAIYALYAFNALYQTTSEAKWLQAAEHAAASSLSWVYTFDYSVPAENAALDAASPFKNGGTSGFSLIASGHSGADNYIAYIYYELYKLYVMTGDPFYFDAALFIQNNTKQPIDLNGDLGYTYRAMLVEATNIADFRLGSLGNWLPWTSVANIEPIMQTENTFGCKDIAEIKDDLQTLRDKLTAAGVGGKLFK